MRWLNMPFPHMPVLVLLKYKIRLKKEKKKLSNNCSFYVVVTGCTKEFWAVPCQEGPKGTFMEKATSLDLCMKYCHDDVKCKGFDWQPSAKRCWHMTVCFTEYIHCCDKLREIFCRCYR